VFQITAALARQKPQNQNIPELGIGAHGVFALNPEELFPSRDLGKVAGHFAPDAPSPQSMNMVHCHMGWIDENG